MDSACNPRPLWTLPDEFRDVLQPPPHAHSNHASYCHCRRARFKDSKPSYANTPTSTEPSEPSRRTVNLRNTSPDPPASNLRNLDSVPFYSSSSNPRRLAEGRDTQFSPAPRRKTMISQYASFSGGVFCHAACSEAFSRVDMHLYVTAPRPAACEI